MSKLLQLNWSAIILVILVTIIGWQFYSITSERDAALVEVANRNTALAEEKGRVKALQTQAENDRKARDAIYSEDLTAVVKTYVKGFHNEKAKDTKTISSLRTQLADSLREQQALRDRTHTREDVTAQLTKDNSDPAPLGQGEESVEFYRNAYLGAEDYIQTLTAAGAMCAADYTACKKYVDDENARLGVEDLVE